MRELIEQAKLRDPDFYIGGKENPYIKRWWMTERQPETVKLYIHNQLRHDEDRALHDHPSDNISIIIEGGYKEHTPEGTYYRKPGDIIHRKAADLHRLELYQNDKGILIPSWSVFIMGHKIRDWGFQCGEKWVPWQQFCDPVDTGNVGRGCE